LRLTDTTLHWEDTMQTLRTIIAGILVTLVLALSGIGLMPGIVTAATPACSWMGCTGGPMQCIFITVSGGGVSVTVTCYQPNPLLP
jgi:hypothetical protein